ncbi:MAG: UPF0149 family protein [Steroidobacteraceae bacterium]
MDSVDYDELQHLMQAAHALTDPAEAHGTLAGALCVLAPYSADDWMAEVLPDGQRLAATENALRSLYEQTISALNGTDFEFDLLLPDDEQSVEARTESLGLWCAGFLYGLGSGGAADVERLGGEAGEIIRDLTQITRAGVDLDDGEEGNESALAELVEYVRVGAQLIYDNLAGMRDTPRPPDAALH